jgi:hypothetical protein
MTRDAVESERVIRRLEFNMTHDGDSIVFA